jgi:hypothetical protein
MQRPYVRSGCRICHRFVRFITNFGMDSKPSILSVNLGRWEKNNLRGETTWTRQAFPFEKNIRVDLFCYRLRSILSPYLVRHFRLLDNLTLFRQALWFADPMHGRISRTAGSLACVVILLFGAILWALGFWEDFNFHDFTIVAFLLNSDLGLYIK